LPDDSPITVYDRQDRLKVTRPGKALFFSDGSVFLTVTDKDGETIAHALDAMTPEGLITLAQALKETEIGPQLQEAAATLRDALGDDAEIDEYIQTENGRIERI